MFFSIRVFVFWYIKLCMSSEVCICISPHSSSLHTSAFKCCLLRGYQDWNQRNNSPKIWTFFIYSCCSKTICCYFSHETQMYENRNLFINLYLFMMCLTIGFHALIKKMFNYFIFHLYYALPTGLSNAGCWVSCSMKSSWDSLMWLVYRLRLIYTSATDLRRRLSSDACPTP